MAKSSVNVSFTGDSSNLEGAFDRVGGSARDVDQDFASAQANMADFDSGMANAANRADVAEQAFIGVADTMDFMADQMGLPVGPVADLTRGFGSLAGAGAALIPMMGQLPGLIRAVGAAMITPPLGIVIAVGAVVAALILLYKNSETFRNIVNGAFFAVRDVAVEVFNTVKNAAMTAWNWISENWPLILTILTGPIAPVILAFTTFKDDILIIVDSVVGFFRDMPGRILGALGNLGGLLLQAGRDLVQGFIDGINSLIGSIPNPLDAIPGYGGGNEDLYLQARGVQGYHRGGTVPGTASQESLAVLRGGERVLTPHQSGGGTTIIVNASGYVRSIDELVADIDRARRRRIA